MKNYSIYAQFYVRLAIGLGFLSAVADRLGWLGMAGQENIAWGNWQSFLDYTHVLLPVLPRPLSDVMGLMATLAETTFGILLIIGFKTRLTAIGSALLTLFFALAMTLTSGIKAPLNYSVFAVSAGACLLAAVPNYRWSLDSFLTRPGRL